MAVCPGVFRLAEARDGGLARIRVPGGMLTAGQLREVARIARDQGNGIVDLTHRANLQIRGIDPRATAGLGDALREIDLVATDPTADRLRNILASPLSGLEPDEIIDVRASVAALDQALQSTPEIHGLSPKFSFLFDGGGSGRVAALAHDVGFIAERSPDDPVFRLSLAGHATSGIVAPGDAAHIGIALAKAVMALCAQGPARMTTALAGRTLADVLSRACAGVPGALLRHEGSSPASARLAPVLGPVRQRQDGLFACGLGIPLGRLADDKARSLADLADTYGDGALRLAPWQAVFVANVPGAVVEPLQLQARTIGLLTEPYCIDMRVTACSGSTGCLRTNCDTKADGAAILRALGRNRTKPEHPLIIHVSGCARGCAHPEASELLLLGRPDGDGYDAYADARPSRAEALRPIASPLDPADLSRFVIEFVKG